MSGNKNLHGVMLLWFGLLPLGVAVSLHGAERSTGAPIKRLPADDRAAASVQTGLAAYYHADFHGRKTANGEHFDHDTLTAAHKTWPFGTLVRVTNLTNDRSVIVRVNDRGPVERSRVIDLTRRAAEYLGFVERGIVRVKIEVVNAAAENDGKENPDEQDHESHSVQR